MDLTRRHFLISGTSLVGACLLPPSFLKRLSRLTDNPAAAIAAPENPCEIHYATRRHSGRWQLSLGWPTGELPPVPSWREWLADYESVDPDDPNDVERWFKKWSPGIDRLSPGWRDEPVDACTWTTYLEGRFLVSDSPEARALHYLSTLNLAHGPLVDDAGAELGRVNYHHGTMPGADSHFVDVHGAAILPALQHRLRKLGENVAIEIIA